MRTIAFLESKLAVLREQVKKTTDPDVKAELEERIDFIQDEVDEMEDAEAEQQAYEEMTGTTPQDIYNDRNAYAIQQSEAIERFRNEY